MKPLQIRNIIAKSLQQTLMTGKQQIDQFSSDSCYRMLIRNDTSEFDTFQQAVDQSYLDVDRIKSEVIKHFDNVQFVDDQLSFQSYPKNVFKQKIIVNDNKIGTITIYAGGPYSVSYLNLNKW